MRDLRAKSANIIDDVSAGGGIEADFFEWGLMTKVIFLIGDYGCAFAATTFISVATLFMS
jgi:hypothetical protein